MDLDKRGKDRQTLQDVVCEMKEDHYIEQTLWALMGETREVETNC